MGKFNLTGLGPLAARRFQSQQRRAQVRSDSNTCLLRNYAQNVENEKEKAKLTHQQPEVKRSEAIFFFPEYQLKLKSRAEAKSELHKELLWHTEPELLLILTYF